MIRNTLSLKILIIVFGIVLTNCTQDKHPKISQDSRADTSNEMPQEVDASETEEIKLTLNSNTIQQRFAPPKGYTRVGNQPNSFGKYLQDYPLLPHGSKVHLYDGQEKWAQDRHAAILDLDVGDRDLQQCADAVMRLRCDYFYKNKMYERIKFNFTNGFPFAYSKWRKGHTVKVNGNKVTWNPAKEPQTSNTDYKKYLNQLFMYAGTLSMSKELKSKPIENLEIGDIFIQGGSPGHAVIIVDVAIHEDTGDKAFLLAQSYMPAQQMHIVINPQNQEISPWYLLSEIRDKVYTPSWTFGKGDLKRF